MEGDFLKALIEGNIEFAREHDEVYREVMHTQAPLMTLLLCSDSTVPSSMFNRSAITSVFSIEVIGNQIETALGSVDYGVMHLKTPILMIMGHTDCGVIKAAIANYDKESDPIQTELDSLQHVVCKDKACRHKDEKRIKVQLPEENVHYQVTKAFQRYNSKVRDGNLTIIGAMFDLHGVYGGNRGEFYIVNVNGDRDIDDIKAHPVIQKLHEELIDLKIKSML